MRGVNDRVSRNTLVVISVDATRRFAAFREAVTGAAESLNDSFVHPDSTWPGVLFLDVPEGVIIGTIQPLAGLDEEGKHVLAEDVLPAIIRQRRAERFAWAMPAYREDRDPPTECLALVIGEPRHCEVLLAEVFRDGGSPKLGQWFAPEGDVSGRFVEPLKRALWSPRQADRRREFGRRPVARSAWPARERKETWVARARRLTPTRQLRPTCPGCGTRISQPHMDECEVERCSVCGGQRLICDCVGHDRRAEVWTGEWPGAAECRALGWWAVRDSDGWRPCPPGIPGAVEDLNRLSFYRQTGYDALYDSVEM